MKISHLLLRFSALCLCLFTLPAQAAFEQTPEQLQEIAKRFQAHNPLIHPPGGRPVDRLDWAAPATGWSLSELASLRKEIVQERELLDAWVDGAFYHFAYQPASASNQPTGPVLRVRALAQNGKIIDVIFYFQALESFYRERKVR